MSRKNIFEILSSNTDWNADMKRIDRLLRVEKTIEVNANSNSNLYSITEYMDKYCFRNWKGRKHCIDVEDFLSTTGYNSILNSFLVEESDFLNFIEIAFNIWKVASERLNSFLTILPPEYPTDKFWYIQEIIRDYLENLNHISVYDKKTQQLLIVEDSPEVTAVAEILDPSLSIKVLRYNHHLLNGDIHTKKAILLELGGKLEPKRPTLKNVNLNLEKYIFLMLNNMDIRHNNRETGDEKYKNYHESVAKMSDYELEQWYDELYQMILLAFLELNQLDRAQTVKKFLISMGLENEK